MNAFRHSYLTKGKKLAYAYNGHYVGIIKGIILTIFYNPTLHST